MRLGIFGGTFDPVHYGHLQLAEACREQCSLDQVWWMPAATPPHKQDATISTAEKRLDMLRLAIGGHEPFVVSNLEIERGGTSYTVDTLQAVREQHVDAELFFLMGADSLADFPTWREPQRICELAIPIVVRRQGAPEPDFSVLANWVSDERLATIQACQVEILANELSSSRIRESVRSGKSIRFQTSRAVEKYIEANKLYADA